MHPVRKARIIAPFAPSFTEASYVLKDIKAVGPIVTALVLPKSR